MTLHRILARFRPDDRIVLSDPGDPDWSFERTFRWSGAGGSEAFPLPPEEELPPPGAAHRDLCAGDEQELESVYGRIVSRRSLAEGDVERFGRYLFEVLLGSAGWDRVRGRLAGGEHLELALEPGEHGPSLHRLNWEMMHGPEGFLANGPLPVVVTRIVSDADAEVRPMRSPPRVLFVLGASLTDPRVRAGAEYLGLLRRIDEEGRTLNARVVEAASPETVRATMVSFEPDVVYLVAHGDFDERGRPFLEFAPERATGSGGFERRFGPQLVDLLTAGGDVAPPSIVVLSACHTGDTLLGAHRTSPLAVELVRGGVPVVVGMAGEVSDRACRHFTRRFGQVLTRGDRLLDAAERGRRAAFVDADRPGRSADWAFPALFLSPRVASEVRPAPLADDDPAKRMVDVMKHLDLVEKPVFCGRHRFFQAYESLTTREGPGVLALYSDPGLSKIGRSRLVRELAAQSLRDGHLPCVILGRENDPPRYRSPLELGLEILRAVLATRQGLGLGPPSVDDGLLALLRVLNGSQELADRLAGVDDPRVRFQLVLGHFAGNADVDADPEAVREGLRNEMAALVRDARTLGPPWDEDPCRPVLLLDDVHHYDLPALSGLLDSMLGGYGIGLPDQPIPVVLTFSLGGQTSTLLKNLLERSPGWLRAEPVEPFKEPEHRLVWRRILLYPFVPADVVRAPEVPLVPNPEAPEEDRERLERNLWAVLRGMPIRFLQDYFFGLVQVAHEERTLIEADDENKLAEMLRTNGS